MRQWALSICGTGMALAMLQMLIPRHKLRSAVVMVFSLVFLLAVISPLTGLFGRAPGISIPEIDQELLERQAADIGLGAMRYTIEADTRRILAQMGIKPISLGIDIDVTGSVYNLRGISIALNAEDIARKDSITALIKQELGQAVEISYMEEDA